MAIIERGRSGEGQRIDVSMVDAAASFLGHQLGELSAGRQNASVAERMFQDETENVFKASDGYLVLYVPEEQWPTLFRAIGWDEFVTGHPYSTPTSRNRHAEELKADLETVFCEYTVDGLIEQLHEEAPGVITAPVNNMAEVLEDPQVSARDIILERSHELVGPYLMAKPVIEHSRTNSSLGDVPALGADTDAILRELGYTEDDIEGLRANDTVR